MAGFLGSSISMTICEANEKKAVTPDLLRKNAFSAAIDPDGYRYGWTGLGELLDTENFSLALTDGRFCGFSYRLDERRPSQAVIRLQVAQKIRAEEQNGAKVGGKRKKEIREEITEKLLSQTEFAPLLIDCIWDMAKGRLLVAATSEKRVERILAHFKASFGMDVWPIAAEKDMARVFAGIQSAGGIELDNFFLETAGSANLSSSPQSEEKCSIAVQNNMDVVAEAVTQGMDIKKMTFLAREIGGEEELRFTLSDDLLVTGLRLPKYDGEDGVEGLFIIHAEQCSQIAQLAVDMSSE